MNNHEYNVFATVGRITRAITYPIISLEYDLTLRELNALATIAHINQERHAVNNDTINSMLMSTAMGQAFFDIKDFYTTFESLAEKGLIEIDKIEQGELAAFLMKDNKESDELYGLSATLTEDGDDLIYSMGYNIMNSLCLLDKKEVRDSFKVAFKRFER